MFLKRLAALAEILLMLAMDNLFGEALYSAVFSELTNPQTATAMTQAAGEGLLILFRLGLAGVFGYLLLYFRCGITPGQAGLTRNSQSLASLVNQGIVLGLVSSFLVAALFAVHSLVPLREGLPAWWTYSDTPIDSVFLVYFLGTSVLIPPNRRDYDPWLF
ncbi:MAG: hypothetical protein QGG54_21850 [Gammaproteobacteria bacterium]|jgi:hypothetical protein|nr:hypothetical protein [Gammaproteobacteria bacterium]MDP6653886.1 hypothetical protein [Gammaproteobacteria bacterium]|tara:strand:+ start:423 stop:905 length:483 start_codon:yes stop_codon:yes gene_type:complete